jgi:hypothetical protein
VEDWGSLKKKKMREMRQLQHTGNHGHGNALEKRTGIVRTVSGPLVTGNCTRPTRVPFRIGLPGTSSDLGSLAAQPVFAIARTVLFCDRPSRPHVAMTCGDGPPNIPHPTPPPRTTSPELGRRSPCLRIAFCCISAATHAERLRYCRGLKDSSSISMLVARLAPAVVGLLRPTSACDGA